MTTQSRVLTAVTILLLTHLVSVSVAFADNPKDVVTPDRHSAPATGKVNTFRVNMADYGVGNNEEKVNATVFFTLDDDPKMVYIIDLKADSPPNNKMMASLLKDAFFNNSVVSVYHEVFSKRSNYHKIHMVEVSRK